MRRSSIPLLTLELQQEPDIVAARQRTRQVASLLCFEGQDQTRITTAVSEIARNAFQYAGGGRAELLLEVASPAALIVRISDRGPGIANLQAILNGQYVSPTGMGLGLIGARRLMDRFEIDSSPGEGTMVTMTKLLPRLRPGQAPPNPAVLVAELARTALENPLAEIQFQNQELLRALAEVERQKAELDMLNEELADTNRGVTALYAEVDEKNRQLERANELKTAFLSNISHEFRTPLNSIIGLSGLLLNRADGDLTPEQEKQVTFIRRSAASLAEMVNDLLDTAKIEAGKVTVQPQEFSIVDLFSSLRGTFRPLLRSDEVTLDFADASNMPLLYTDDGKVSQVLRNLLSNALKFTERGSIRVAVGLLELDDTRVVFSVTDTGIGVAPEDQERIFEDFGQVEGVQQKRAKGTGLGLPLSRRLSEILGGSLSIQSESGVGSTFRFILPRQYSGPAEVIIGSSSAGG